MQELPTVTVFTAQLAKSFRRTQTSKKSRKEYDNWKVLHNAISIIPSMYYFI
jgi:hypothetical protein